MRYARTTVAALTCALVALPAGAAFAGSGPAPKAAQRNAVKSAAPSAQGNPASKAARAAGVCSDAYQIGDTGYVKRSGTTVASVKQFYSPDCKQNYGYVWVWDSFHQGGSTYDITAGVYSYSQDKVLGSKAWAGSSAQEFWSSGTNSVTQCTAAVGSLRKAGDPLSNQAASSKRC